MGSQHNPKEFVPIGTGSGMAALRMGLTELRNTLYPESNVAVNHVEPGMWGTATQYEVNQERLGETPAPAGEHKSVVDDRVKLVEASRDGRGRDAREPELDRE